MPTPRNNKTLKHWQRQLLLVVAFVVLTGLSAQASFYLDEYLQFTLQTLCIGLFYSFMPRSSRVIAITLYLAAGILGLEVFSSWGSGWKHFTGPSLGFFIAFFLVAWINPMRGSFSNHFSYFALIHIIILLLGSGMIAFHEKELRLFTEFSMILLPGAVIKSLLGAYIAQQINKRI